MKRLFAVVRSRGPAWRNSLSMEEQTDWSTHASFMNGLEGEGIVVLGGPLGATSDLLLIVRAESPEEIAERFSADPWTRSGLLLIARVSAWTLRLGSLPRA